MMLSYELSLDAEDDLREIARYTLKRWGREALREYQDGLKRTINAIGDNTAQARTFSTLFPRVLVTKYRYHYIFYLSDNNKKPIIIGVIHERRDVVSRLSERLAGC